MAKKSDLKRVAEVEDARFAAMINRDKKALDKLLADDWSYGHTSGSFDTKAKIIAKMDRKDFDYVFFKVIRREIRHSRGVYISCGTFFAEYRDNGKSQRAAMVFTGVYSDDKDLKCLALHVNRIMAHD